MKNRTRTGMILALMLGLAACGEPATEEGRRVDASGKEATEFDAVPAEVLDLARTTRPDLSLTDVEYETRDGNEYYDVAGTLPDGSELELDMTKLDGIWTVVEVQRDIEFGQVPGGAGSALLAKFPAFQPQRIIESDQGDGVIIYEFFGTSAAGEDTKIEVKWEQDVAEVLTDEWIH